MSNQVYDFDQQLEKSKWPEARLDRLFSFDYQIFQVSSQQQREGIDRIFIRKSDKKQLRIEYKADWTASRTGNIFIETVSNDKRNKPGWAYTSTCDFLIYFLPNDDLAYVLEMRKIKRSVDNWRKKYPVREIPNAGYSTIGVIIPQWEFERMAIQVCNQVR